MSVSRGVGGLSMSRDMQMATPFCSVFPAGWACGTLQAERRSPLPLLSPECPQGHPARSDSSHLL